MENHDWRILYIDDDPDDYYLTREKLARVRQGRFTLDWVASYEQGCAALLAQGYDAAVVDYDLPGHTGIELIQAVLRAGCEIPILLITGQGNYEVDMQAMQAGAADYLSKDELTAALLERSIRYAIERKRAKRELEQERARLEAVLQALPVGLAICDAQGGVLLTNQSYVQIWGRVPPETRSIQDYHAFKAWWAESGQLVQPHEWASAQSLLHGKAVTGQFIEIERFDGQHAFVLNGAAPILDAQGKVTGSAVAVMDITDRVQAELALRDSEATLRDSENRFHVAIATLPIAVFHQDTDLRYTWIYNPQGGYQVDEVIGRTDMEIVPAADGAELFALKRRVIETGKGIKKELWVRLGGVAGCYVLNLEPLLNEEGQVVGITGSSLDVTTERQLEAAQREAQAQVEVHRRLMEQREMERMDIARDLHDGPLQELTAIGYAIAEAIEIDQKAERIARLKSAQQLLSKQSHEIRVFCNDLRPPALAPFGLERAIRSHIEDFRERCPTIQVHLSLTPDRQLLPENTRMALFRIYQEVLNNVGKHAKASDVWINLTIDDEMVILEIEDNGVGYKVPHDWAVQARSGHLGLIGMRERASAIGAQIEFDSQPGRGARVRVAVERG